MELSVESDSHIELSKNVYGREHRIILYHSQSLEKRRRAKFMKRMDKVMARVKSVTVKMECKSDVSELIRKAMNLESMIKE
ncbi:MAG: hypothetical protein ACYCSA_01830 [Thermoplasmataceae archaeon]